MKIIQNPRKRIIEKYKAKQRLKIKREFENKEKQLTEEHRKEIDKTIKYHESIIENLQSRHENEIAKIREQERAKYQPIIEERNNEITRMNKIISESKEFYNLLKDREFKFEEISHSTQNNYERCLVKFQEGLAILRHTQNDIEKHNRQIAQIEKHHQKLLEDE